MKKTLTVVLLTMAVLFLMNLTACYLNNTYRVTLIYGNGIESDYVEVLGREKDVLSKLPQIKEKYAILSWHTSEDLSDDSKVTSLGRLKSDITLYAKMEDLRLTITVSANDVLIESYIVERSTGLTDEMRGEFNLQHLFKDKALTEEFTEADVFTESTTIYAGIYITFDYGENSYIGLFPCFSYFMESDLDAIMHEVLPDAESFTFADADGTPLDLPAPFYNDCTINVTAS